MALRVPPLLHLLRSGGVARIVATRPTLIGCEVLFSVKPFQISCTFQGKIFLILAFPFSFPHFLSVIGFSDFPVVHFALSLLSFLPYF